MVVFQAVLTAQEKEAQELAALELQRKLEEVLIQTQENAKEAKSEVSDEEIVDNVFDFLPSTVGGQEGPAPEGFEVKSLRDLRLRNKEIQSVGMIMLNLQCKWVSI